MKTKSKVSIIVLVIASVLGFAGPIAVFAAATPSLGTAITFGILSSTYTNTTASTTINGDVGYTTPPAASPTINGTLVTPKPPQAGIDQGVALSSLASQVCGNGTTIPGYTFANGAIDLATDTTHGTIRHYSPGVYCVTGAMNIGTAGIVLDTPGTYIFRSTGAFDTTDTSTAVTLGTGVLACDVFWTPGAATTIHANNTFVGTVIDDAGITVGNSTAWTGRALSFGGTITTDADTISVPTCANATTLHIIKTLINDNGGILINTSDFSFLVNGTTTQAFEADGQNDLNVIAGTSYTVTEPAVAGYSTSYDNCSDIVLATGGSATCTITNNDIPQSSGGGGSTYVPPVPPLIDVVKIPNPLALPAGPGSVTYAYTVRNIGTVPMANVTVVDDACHPVTFISGDTNADAKLDVNETWTYNCSVTLSATRTNTVVATGWANGLSATDIASATVIVGATVVPPLIHLTKVPSPLTLPIGGGLVTYTEKITNPGLVALSNVRLTDDKCAPMKYISGDANGDSKLDIAETWTYTCQTNLAKTTMNTAIAEGSANGLTIKDFAIATVVVANAAIPTLPNTGLPPERKNIPWNIFIPSGILAISILFYIARKKTV